MLKKSLEIQDQLINVFNMREAPKVIKSFKVLILLSNLNFDEDIQRDSRDSVASDGAYRKAAIDFFSEVLPENFSWRAATW